MSLLQELSDTAPQHIDIIAAVDKACAALLTEANSRGGRVTPKNGREFFNSNPKLVIGAAAMAISAQRAYQANKRGTFTLHAKNAQERRMITTIVDALTTSKKFVVARTKFQGGGKSWVLKQL